MNHAVVFRVLFLIKDLTKAEITRIMKNILGGKTRILVKLSGR